MQKSRKMTGICSMIFLLWLMALPLTVQAAPASGVSIEKTIYVPGETIRVMFKASGDWPTDAWIGIIPSNISHGSEEFNDQYDITYQYIEKRTNGVMEFIAPEPGRWDLRMHDTDDNGREIAYISFVVQ